VKVKECVLTAFAARCRRSTFLLGFLNDEPNRTGRSISSDSYANLNALRTV
jgi:hypothetical protein